MEGDFGLGCFALVYLMQVSSYARTADPQAPAAPEVSYSPSSSSMGVMLPELKLRTLAPPRRDMVPRESGRAGVADADGLRRVSVIVPRGFGSVG